MRARIGLIGGGLGVAGLLISRVARRGRGFRRGVDPAAELRRKLEESRSIVEEREEFEAAETTVDQVEPGVDERRRAVHDRARSAIEDTRSTEQA